MKKKIIAIIMALAIVIALPTKTNALSYAEAGTTMANPINITFNNYYTKSWTKSSDHLYCYNRVDITSKGILKMTFSKPFDAEGEYGKLKVIVYDQDANPIWDTTSYSSVENASPNYNYYIGLDKGTYYITITPGFIVRSGSITTDYIFSFTKNDYTEVEPNETTAQSTALSLNKMYSGYYGNEYGDYGENDYYKFSLTKNKKYKIVMENFDKLDATTAIIYLYAANGEKTSIGWNFDKIDNNDNKYFEYTAPTSGNYYIQIYNYSHEQVPYKIGIYDLSQDVTVAKVKDLKVKSTTENSIKLSWKKVSGASKYQVYQYNSKTKKYEKIDTIKDTSIKVKKLKAGTTYKFKVRAYKSVDGEKYYGSYSSVLETATNPTKVTKLKVKSTTENSIKLSWNKVSGASKYQVYQYNSKTKKYEKIDTIKDTSIKVKKLKAGTTYKFKVRAYRSVDGEKYYGEYSSVLETATNPTKVTKLKVKSQTKNSVKLTWKKVSGASKYQVYQYNSKTKKYERIDTIKDTSIKVKKLKKGTTYKFKVRAYRSVDGKKYYGEYSSVKSVKI